MTSLFPPDPRMERFAAALRVADALADGASIAQMAEALYGTQWAGPNGGSDSLKSRIRRLVRDARSMAAGEYRSLMGMEIA